MENIYLVIVVILMALAVLDLIVGVSNDAVNFLNSAVGSKVAPRYVIMIVASIGILAGVLTSSGMMEVARSGVFHPGMFTFQEIMMLFLAVMLTDVILLDIFNTLGLPTSTTVSLVFELLGAAVAVAAFKIIHSSNLTMADLSQYINSGKAMAIISGILISVVIAFVCGTVIMAITRIIFSYKYQSKMKHIGAVWCGIALTAISYFAIFKGLKGTSVISPDIMDWMSNNTLSFLMIMVACWTVLMSILSMLRVNTLKITVLAGTLSLALAFAGNDLVNFIGVFMAGYDSYNIAKLSGDTMMLMGDLTKPVTANILILLASGVVMTLTLWFSKKARTVTDTEVNLARQDAGVERFGSTSVSRSIVRSALNINKSYEKYTPQKIQDFISSRFVPVAATQMEAKDRPSFDLIRATVNLTVASILISMATSLKLPLSTTYVTFMVAMGSSLSDRAWGRESAVYRITGVLTVISGWFLTALIAFTIASLIAFLLMWGGVIAIIALCCVCALMIIRSSLTHAKKRRQIEAKEEVMSSSDSVLDRCVSEITETMKNVTDIYNRTLTGLFNEDRKLLRQTVKESEELFHNAHDRKHELLPTLQKINENYIDTGHYYVQVVDYMNEVTKALVHVTRPSFDHINNNHEGLTKEQVDDLRLVNDEVSLIYGKINEMLKTNNFDDLDEVLAMRDNLFETLANAIKRQIRRVKNKETTTRSSILYLTILNETKTMVLQSRNLLKSQKYFVSKQ